MGRLIAGLFNMVALILIAKQLGARDFGIYSLALTLGLLFSALATFGMAGLATREIARKPSEAATYLLNGFLAILTLGGPLFVAGALTLTHVYPDSYPILIWGAAAAAFKLPIDYMGSLLSGLDRVPHAATYNTVQAVGTSLLSLLLLLLFHAPLSVIFQAHLALNLVLTILLGHYVWTLVGGIGGIRVALSSALGLLKQSLPFGIFALGSLLYFQSDTLMLASMKGVQEVGHFQAAMRIVLAIDVAPAMVASALYPVISRRFVEDPESFMRAGMLMVRYMVAISLPVALVCSFGAPFLTAWVFGPEYGPSTPILAMVAWLIPIRFAGHVLGTMLSAGDKQAGRAVATILATGLNIMLNLFLIPTWGGGGAAVASVLTSGGLIAFYAWSLVSDVKLKNLIQTVLSLFVPAVVAIIVHRALQSSGAVLALIVALLAYAILSPMLGAVRLRDFAALRQSLRKEPSHGVH